MVFLDLSSLQTNLYTRLRITDWQHWVFVIAQVALVLSNLDKPMFIFRIYLGELVLNDMNDMVSAAYINHCGHSEVHYSIKHNT